MLGIAMQQTVAGAIGKWAAQTLQTIDRTIPRASPQLRQNLTDGQRTNIYDPLLKQLLIWTLTYKREEFAKLEEGLEEENATENVDNSELCEAAEKMLDEVDELKARLNGMFGSRRA
jgi:hypothetical protein